MLKSLCRMLAACAPLALVSCTLPLPQVDDIAVAGVALVRASDIPRQDRDIVARAIDGPFLRIDLTSAHDVQKLAHDWNYTIGADAAACAGAGDAIDPAKRLLGLGGLYDRHGPVYMYAEKRLTSGPGAPFRYHLYVAVRAAIDADLPADAPQHSYDLAAHPQPVCLRLAGRQEVDGDGWGFAKFASNVVRIDASRIAAAVR